MTDYLDRIGWIDEYVRALAPYIHVREADSLLIKIPNEAYKLNPQGLKILKFLLSGGSVRSILEHHHEKEKVADDLNAFFRDLQAVLKGSYREWQARRAVEKIPFSIPYNTLPVLSEIAVTYDCNLACKFCYAACGCRKDPSAAGLSTGQWKEVLGIIRNEADVPSVSFTGGEPTLREDLAELVSHAHSLRMWTNLITNGTLVSPELAKTLKSAGLDSAQVSIEGGTAGVHDSIVGMPGAFDAAVAGLKNLKGAGIRVHTNTTVSALNRDRLDGILDFVAGIGLDKFSMNMIMPAGSALAHDQETFVSYSEIGELVLGVQRKAGELGLEFMWYSPTPVCIFNPIAHGLGNKGCAACDGLLSVAPDGNLLPCSSYPKPLGNILEHKGRFKALWEAPESRYFREKRFAHDVCQPCERLAVCNGGCPLYWNQAGYRELLEVRGMEGTDVAISAS